MKRHLTTDPACWYHTRPRTRWQRWRFERNRGRSCPLCMQPLRVQVGAYALAPRQASAVKPRWTCLDCRHANRDVGHAGCSGWPCACPCRILLPERDTDS